jgi:hypothetical protein
MTSTPQVDMVEIKR